MGRDVGTRTRPVSITEGPHLAQVWPQTARVLQAFLRSRGSSPQDAEDLVQECAVRVLRTRPTFVDAADLLRWCLPVVRNMSVDLHRKGCRDVSVESVPDRHWGGDVADEVVVALELRRVLRALQQLRPSDREAILAHVAEDGSRRSLDRKQAVRINVQLHRARQRLLARLAALLGICVALGRRMGRVSGPAGLPVALAVALLTTVIGGSTGQPAPRTAPGQTSVTQADRRLVVVATIDPSSQRPRRPPAPAELARRTRTVLPREKATIAAVTTPQGVTARLTAGDPRQPGTLVCVRDVDPLPDVCIPQVGTGAKTRGSAAAR